MKQFDINAFMPLIRVWSKYKSPWVPEGEELEIFKKFLRLALKKQKNKRVLVLGSTPQLRDLAHDLGAEVTVVDVSLNMMMGLPYLMKNKKSVDKEIWVRSGWLDAPLQHNHWDVVLGDWVICNIPKRLQTTFAEKIKNILIPGGFFITKAYFVWEKKISANQVINNFLKKLDPSFRDYQDYFQELCYARTNKITWNHSVNDVRFVLGQFYKNLKDNKLKLKIKKHLKMLDYILGKGDFVWACPTGKEGERVFTKYFTIKDKQFSKEHPFGKNNPIYLFQRK